jgi:pyruvate,water dikinase
VTVEFTAPGPGTWELDRSHYASGITPITEEIMRDAVADAYREGFERLGVPAETIVFASVNGFAYSRVRPLFGADSNSERTPPDRLVKLIGRLHPEMRRREKRAAAELETGDGFKTTLDEWKTTIKPTLLARNLEYQSTDLTAFDENSLADHLDGLVAYFFEMNVLHHRLHIDDLGPIGVFVVHCREWGIETDEAVQALIGASPSTSEPRRRLAEIRAAVEKAGVMPSSLDDVRAVSADVSEKLDSYLGRHGSVLYSGYDLDTPTLSERSDVIVTAIMSAIDPATDDERGATAAQAMRDAVPSTERDEFDRLLGNARLALDMRDDNGPLTIEWPGGLLRLGLLEAGHRLAAQGRLAFAHHVFELAASEISSLLRSGDGPDAAEVARRAEERAASRTLEPPLYLGPDPVEPPLHLLPPAMARTMNTVVTVMQALFGAKEGSRAPLTGTGIGDEPFTGIARTAETAEEAIATMEDGDILVTRATSPAFNLVLAIAGGLVTVHGGPMSHAAVLSRELRLPAVIGVEDCLEHINTGDRVEIDPTNGTVRVLD